MTMQSLSPASKKPVSLFLTIIWSWLLVGTLDAIGASINYILGGRRDPGKIFQYISSAILGPESYSAGTKTVLLGILLHYMVALLFTIFFFLLARRMSWMRNNRILAGIFYGAFMWAVMTFVVLPVTKIPPGTLHPKPVLTGILILVVAIGLPLSFIASAYYAKYAEAQSTT